MSKVLCESKRGVFLFEYVVTERDAENPFERMSCTLKLFDFSYSDKNPVYSKNFLELDSNIRQSMSLHELLKSDAVLKYVNFSSDEDIYMLVNTLISNRVIL